VQAEAVGRAVARVGEHGLQVRRDDLVEIGDVLAQRAHRSDVSQACLNSS
jgi:hypothetical protein